MSDVLNGLLEAVSELDPSPPPARGPRKPFGGKKRLYNVVKVRFKTSFLTHDVDAQLLDLERGDEVIVETSRGPALAEVAGEIGRAVAPSGSLRKVLRLASEEDRRIDTANRLREREAFRFALDRVRARELDMKLIQVQLMHDGSKAIFYFSADGRIDFRELVRDLANRFRTRIEMRQIGVRDGARMIGGIGSCGRELCCSTFLSNFAPVSIRMAKDQGLTLNPKKVSGMCGRLMCCLVYEQHIYRKTLKRLPRAGKPVLTALGVGTIRTVDVVQEKVGVLLDDGQYEVFAAHDVAVLSARDAELRRGGASPAAPPPDALNAALSALNPEDDEPYIWEDDPGASADAADSVDDEPQPPAREEPPREERRGERRGSGRRGGGRPSSKRGEGEPPRDREARSSSKRSAGEGERGRRARSAGGEGGREGRPRREEGEQRPAPAEGERDKPRGEGEGRGRGRRRGGRRRGGPGGDSGSEPTS